MFTILIGPKIALIYVKKKKQIIMIFICLNINIIYYKKKVFILMYKIITR